MGGVTRHLGVDHGREAGPGSHHGLGRSKADGFVDQIAPAAPIAAGDHHIGHCEGADGDRDHAQHDDNSRYGHPADVSQWT